MGKFLFVLAFAFLTAASVFSDSSSTRDPIKLRKTLNEKKKALESVTKARQVLEKIQKPEGTQNDCSRCDEQVKKCNSWPALAEKRESVGVACKMGNCDIHPQIESNERCIAVRESECFNSVLSSADRKYVQRCWLVVKQESIDSMTGKIIELNQEIFDLEAALSTFASHDTSVEDERVRGKNPTPAHTTQAKTPSAPGDAKVSN